jgi:hypothetical protein
VAKEEEVATQEKGQGEVVVNRKESFFRDFHQRGLIFKLVGKDSPTQQPNFRAPWLVVDPVTQRQQNLQ